ncbi:hypothetical protein [Corynebacterium glyciniphilum]|uniref:hypothetical protein n=1 Tax=Corynebacterium glyciniphilum TaxID=1404244 RepID=UPI000698C844|nr:hypothetical protein [Corynebacterium glyciniphilum]
MGGTHLRVLPGPPGVRLRTGQVGGQTHHRHPRGALLDLEHGRWQGRRNAGLLVLHGTEGGDAHGVVDDLEELGDPLRDSQLLGMTVG